MQEETKQISVCVFGASSDGIDEVFKRDAYQLGALMAQRGWTGINGGGAKGVMGAVTNGALDNGGNVTGVIPKFMVDNNWQYDRLQNLLVTADMHQRKEMMLQMCDAVVACAGGCGTLEELMETYTWKQLGIINVPIILLNTEGFYDALATQLQVCVSRGMMSAEHGALWHIAATPEEAVRLVDELTSAAPEVVSSKQA